MLNTLTISISTRRTSKPDLTVMSSAMSAMLTSSPASPLTRQPIISSCFTCFRPGFTCLESNELLSKLSGLVAMGMAASEGVASVNQQEGVKYSLIAGVECLLCSRHLDKDNVIKH